MTILRDKILWLLGLLLVVAAACDTVDGDDRLIYVKPAPVSRAVLIEDFTGQRCVNCPKATEVIEQLQQQYGAATVIAVGIHSGPFARSVRGQRYALGTDDGDAYYAARQVDHQPCGMVNRLGLSDYTDWGAAVYNQVQGTAPLSIDLTIEADTVARTAVITTSMMGTDGATDGSLQLWVVEDGIVDFQYLPDNTIDRDYVHHHVFRAAVNGTWGEAVQLAEGQTLVKAHTLSLDEAWVPRNLSIVAFVYNDRGVQQVVSRPLVKVDDESAMNEN